eukprot:COSAG04_NODE_1193_length_7792_cov_7.972442_6_plen_77_part_00
MAASVLASCPYQILIVSEQIRERDGRAAAAATASAVLAAEPVGEDRPQNARGMVGTDRLPADDLVAANGGAVWPNT